MLVGWASDLLVQSDCKIHLLKYNMNYIYHKYISYRKNSVRKTLRWLIAMCALFFMTYKNHMSSKSVPSQANYILALTLKSNKTKNTTHHELQKHSHQWKLTAFVTVVHVEELLVDSAIRLLTCRPLIGRICSWGVTRE